jgi:hypothetical protein
MYPYVDTESFHCTINYSIRTYSPGTDTHVVLCGNEARLRRDPAHTLDTCTEFFLAGEGYGLRLIRGQTCARQRVEHGDLSDRPRCHLSHKRPEPWLAKRPRSTASPWGLLALYISSLGSRDYS